MGHLSLPGCSRLSGHFFPALLPWSHCRLICGMFLKCFQRTPSSKGHNNCKAPSIFWQMQWGKNAAWSLQSGICLQETTKDSCLLDSQILTVCFKSVFCTNSALGEIPALQQLSCCAQRAENIWISAEPTSPSLQPVCAQSRNPHPLSHIMEVQGPSCRHRAKLFVLEE